MVPARQRRSRIDQHRLRLVRPPEEFGGVRHWHINGYLASIQCWTEEEFQQLPNPPEDAVHYPQGVWIRLYWN